MLINICLMLILIFFFDYKFFLIFIIFFFLLFYFIRKKKYPGSYTSFVFTKTNETYECGYKEMFFIKNSYTFQFYIIALSFIFFDIEIMLVIPLPVCFSLVTMSYLIGIFFLITLLLRLLWEYVFCF